MFITSDSLSILLFVGHTPLHKDWGCGQLVNLQDRDDLSRTDKNRVPNVSAVQRFHCSNSTPFSTPDHAHAFSLTHQDSTIILFSLLNFEMRIYFG